MEMASQDESGRKSLPHLPSRELFNQSIIQFITTTVAGRRSILTSPEILNLLMFQWRAADRWLVGRFVIMPDHLHLFCAPATHPPSELYAWIRYWRSQVTKNWPRVEEKPIWQKDFFDRQLRSGESYQEKWQYILQNPVRAGLVTKAQDWPFQGELNDLTWHEPSSREG